MQDLLLTPLNPSAIVPSYNMERIERGTGMQVIQTLNGIFWGWLVAGILLGTGVFFTIRLKFPQIRYFPKLFGNLRDSMKSEGGLDLAPCVRQWEDRLGPGVW